MMLQKIEANALSLFHTHPSSGAATLSPVLHSNPSIHVPYFLHHDLTKQVLIQSDLGKHSELNKFLTSTNTTPALASSAGASLGCFLKDMHGAFDDASDVIREGLCRTFANDEGEAVLCKTIAGMLDYMKDAGVEDYVLLEKRAQDNWTRRRRTVFGQGDIWFGTVLVDVKDGEVEVGICDWEFAGFNHPAGDISQLGQDAYFCVTKQAVTDIIDDAPSHAGSYLHLASMSPLTSPPSQNNLQSFSSAFYSSYLSPSFSSAYLRAEFQRNLVIMHAWEMINAAAWRHYIWCDCPGKDVKCNHIADMIRVGARLLRAAGDADKDRTIRDIDWDALKDIDWCVFLRLK
jgi:hypothetical protein